MPSFVPLLFSSLVAITITMVAKTAVVVVVKAEPDLGLVSAICGHHRDEHPPHMKDRAKDLTDWAVRFGYPGGVGFCVTAKTDPLMYGYSWCPGTVTGDDCWSCLSYAQNQLMNVYCKDLYGAQLTLNGCFMRYETYPFCKAPE